MNNLLRLLILGMLAALAVIALAVGLARHNGDLLAPFDLLLFALAVVAYFAPSILALYRNCHATPWILLFNTLLGWTIAGWFIAMGWAASGKANELPRHMHTPPESPVPGR